MNKKILVVVDMQKDFITGPLSNDECTNTVERIENLIEKGDYDEIYLTYDTHNEDYLETNEGKNLPIPHCIEGTTGHELDDRIQKAIDAASDRNVPIITFEKDTFGSIDLAHHMMNKHLSNIKNEFNTQIDFCGVCTGFCVISNALLTKTVLPETNIRVIANACACVTAESHKRALESMKTCHIQVVE